MKSSVLAIQCFVKYDTLKIVLDNIYQCINVENYTVIFCIDSCLEMSIINRDHWIDIIEKSKTYFVSIKIKMIKLLRLGYTEFSLVFANFCAKYIAQNATIAYHTKQIRSIYTDWIYKTAGYYDKDILQKENYIYPNDFTDKLDIFIDQLGTLLHRFDQAYVLVSHRLSNPTHPLYKYISEFERFYDIKLHPYNIECQNILPLIKDKKVLVVSSFKELIDQQIDNGNFKHLHPELTNSTFITYKFPYTFLNDGPHNDSFETLNHIKQQLIDNYRDFDIAILACGCYGSFLTDTICNEMHKDAVYIGGQLPLIFGIIGQRDKWAINELYHNKYQYIIDGVPDQYRPQGYKKIENGCYW